MLSAEMNINHSSASKVRPLSFIKTDREDFFDLSFHYVHLCIVVKAAGTVQRVEEVVASASTHTLTIYQCAPQVLARVILAVFLLQRNAGVKRPLYVVPLFETLDDLNNASATME